MVAPFVALQYQTGTPQMIRYGGFPAPVGNSFGTADTIATGTSNPIQPSGRVIQFGGLNTYLASTGTNIWRTTDGGTTWTSVYTYAFVTSPNCNKSGFNVFYVNGIPAVCNMWVVQSPSNLMNFIYSFDGVTWSTVQGAYVNFGGADIGIDDSLVIGTSVYYTVGTRAEVLLALPGSGTCVSFGITGGSGSVTPTLCQFNNRLFVLYIRTAATSLSIAEIVGQTTTLITTLDSSLTVVTANSQWALFVDGVNMFAIAIGSTSGYRAWQIDSALSVTEITSTVLPTALTQAQSLGTRLRVLTDGVTSPGSAPTIYLYYSSNANSNWAIYRWNGNASQISLLTQGGSTLNSLPYFHNVTGTYFVSDSVFPSTAGLAVAVTNRSFTATGVRLSFKIYGTSAGGAVSFRIYVGDETAEYPTTAGTLTNPSVGAISGGNINTGLTADDGVTTYQVTWAAQTDGFSTNEQFRLVGDAFV